MLKNKKLLVITLSIILVLLLAGYTTIQHTKLKYEFSTNDNKQKLEELNNQIISAKEDADASEIISQVENIAKDFKDDDLLSVLTNDDLDKNTKQLFLEKADAINSGKGIEDDAKFISLLYNKDIDDDIRSYLISKTDFDTKYEKDALQDLVCDPSYNVSVRAMNKLQSTDAVLALETADKIISENNKNDDVVRAAIMTKSAYFEDMYLSEKHVSEDEKKDYIDFCINKYDETQDEVLKDAIVFSLMNMRDFNAIKAVVGKNDIDNEMKKTCISRNTSVLGEVLRNDPTKEDFDFVLSAIELLPVYELSVDFKECITENAEYNNYENANVLLQLESSNVYADNNRDKKGITTEWLK